MRICQPIRHFKSIPRFSPVFVTLSKIKLTNLSSKYRKSSSILAVLKTAVAQVTEGSNPSFSANYLQMMGTAETSHPHTIFPPFLLRLTSKS